MQHHTISLCAFMLEKFQAQTTTPEGKQFNLPNLPYYAASQIEKYLAWVQTQD
ncbi:MAG: hypothetical protein ACOYXT_10065 [Bacteroidota bacterium]